MAQQFAEFSMQTLSRDALFSIFQRMRPLDIIELCRTATMIDVCRMPNMVALLLNWHFPGMPHGDNPWRMFNSLARGEVSSYRITYTDQNYDDLYLRKVPSDPMYIVKDVMCGECVDIYGYHMDGPVWVSASFNNGSGFITSYGCLLYTSPSPRD